MLLLSVRSREDAIRPVSEKQSVHFAHDKIDERHEGKGALLDWILSYDSNEHSMKIYHFSHPFMIWSLRSFAPLLCYFSHRSHMMQP